MRTGSGLTVVAPSSSLLRFLRSQSEQVCFFTPSSGISCQSTLPRRTSPSCPGISHHLQNAARYITTTPSRKATVESSLLNLDFLWPPSKYGPTKRLDSASAQRPANTRIVSKYTNANRHASTRIWPLFNRLLKPSEHKERPRTKPTNLPPLPTFLDDVGGTSLGRNKAGKAANELKLRCTEFDKDGKVTLMDGEFKKTELIAKVWTATMSQHAKLFEC